MKKESKKETKKETKKVKVEEIRLPSLNLKRMKVKLKGKTPLLMNRMSDKTKLEILEKQMGKSRGRKTLRVVDEEIKTAIHHLPKGSKTDVGFPVMGFKAAMVNAATFFGSKLWKKDVKGVMIVNEVNGLIPIYYNSKDVLEHNPIGEATRFSPKFNEWSCELVLEYDANVLSAQDILTLLNYAGFHIGIGSWSPRSKSGGGYGMFEVAVK